MTTLLTIFITSYSSLLSVTQYLLLFHCHSIPYSKSYFVILSLLLLLISTDFLRLSLDSDLCTRLMSRFHTIFTFIPTFFLFNAKSSKVLVAPHTSHTFVDFLLNTHKIYHYFKHQICVTFFTTFSSFFRFWFSIPSIQCLIAFNVSPLFTLKIAFSPYPSLRYYWSFFFKKKLFNATIFFRCPKHTFFGQPFPQMEIIVVYVSYVLAFNCRTEGSEGALNICDLCLVGSHFSSDSMRP